MRNGRHLMVSGCHGEATCAQGVTKFKLARDFAPNEGRKSPRLTVMHLVGVCAGKGCCFLSSPPATASTLYGDCHKG